MVSRVGRLVTQVDSYPLLGHEVTIVHTLNNASTRCDNGALLCCNGSFQYTMFKVAKISLAMSGKNCLDALTTLLFYKRVDIKQGASQPLRQDMADGMHFAS